MDEILEHQNCESQKSETFQGFRQAFVIASQAAETSCPSKTTFDNPASGQQDEAFFRFRQLDHFQSQAFGLGCLGWIFSGVALINKRDLHRLPSDLLHLLSQFMYLGSILFIGWSYMESQQMTQRVHGNMSFVPFFSLGTIVACTLTTFRRGLQGSAVKNGSRWLFMTSFRQA